MVKATSAGRSCMDPVQLHRGKLVCSNLNSCINNNAINAGISLLNLLLVLSKFTALRSGGSTEGVESEVLAM